MVVVGEDARTPEIVASPALFGRVEQRIASGQLDAALNDLCDGLADARERMGREAWSAFTREARTAPLAELLHEDPLTRRAFDKPRGYAGDAVMMDYIYGIHAYHGAIGHASPLGRQIMTSLRRRPAAAGVRFRREHIAALIDDLALTRMKPHILAIAAGHLREIERSAAIASGCVGRFVALDADAASLLEVTARYGHLGVETIKASVRDLIARKVSTGRFDFVYAAGLYDYLTDPVAQALTERLFALTEPGGRLLIPNFAPRCVDRAYMETFMAWDLIYRDEFDMARLVEPIPAEQIASYDIYGDPSGSIVYLSIRKTA